MVNVRGVANKAIQSINPNITATLKICTGFTTDAAGKQIATYEPKETSIQNQPMSSKEIMLINAMNFQGGTFHAVHMWGNYQGIKRLEGKGADMLIFRQFKGAEPREWLIIQVMESWPDWCRLLLCRQN